MSTARSRFTLGPGALVTAAFVGPGTVTACTVAGADFGHVLIWTLIFSTIATIVLQDMAARLGVGARLGLGQALMKGAPNPVFKAAAGGLVLVALAIGNAAYEAGNLSGGALGLELVLGIPDLDRRIAVLLLGALAGALLITGRYAVLERVLIVLVLIMSLAFLASAILVRPDLGVFFAGFVPRLPDAGVMTAVALIGTTIVPYNLFLHAATARERWTEATPDALAEARTDTRLSIGLGGLISIAILSTAAAGLFGSGIAVKGAPDMARALEPVFGDAARLLVGSGLLAAGLTSAITAPMATAYAVREVLPARDGLDPDRLFRAVALAILAVGVAVSCLNINVISLIVVAQFANGLLLPVVAGFLLWTMNRKTLLGVHVNGPLSNGLGLIVILVTVGLGLRSVSRALGLGWF